jgi:hypothetical protein
MSSRRSSKVDPNTLVLLKQIGIGVAVIACVGFVVAAVWYGTRLPAVTLTTVEVSGGETIDHELVRTTVLNQLTGEYLGLVPRRFSYTYPREDIIAELDVFDRMHNLVVERSSRTTLAVQFDEYEPTALWCTERASDECFFLSANGNAFAPAPQLSGGSFVRYSHLQTAPAPDESILLRDQFTTSQQLVAELAGIGWYVKHVEVDQVGDAFLHLNEGGELKVSLDDDPEQVIENLLVVLGSEAFQHLEPGNFAYFDLRFGEKVFVNEFGEPAEAAETTFTSTSTATSSGPATAEG